MRVCAHPMVVVQEGKCSVLFKTFGVTYYQTLLQEGMTLLLLHMFIIRSRTQSTESFLHVATLIVFIIICWIHHSCAANAISVGHTLGAFAHINKQV